jgi:CRP-like cAMP-binding protein
LCHGRHKVFNLGQGVYKKGDEVDGFYIVRKGTFMIKKSILLGNLFYKKVNTS